VFILLETLDDCRFLTRHLTKIDCDNCLDLNKICPGKGNVMSEFRFNTKQELLEGVIQLTGGLNENKNN
jgi:hypothetical protein